MCVIIARQPGIILPADKMESACITNSDGYGLSIIDRGKIETIKEYDPKGNDVNKIMKRLEDAKDQQVYLHLRFRTSGDKTTNACHPFDTFTKEQDGFHISFMHNGTLGEFDDPKSEMPDSHHFNMQIVRPLLERVRAFCTTDDMMLKDDFVQQILTKYAGSSSKFVLFDQNGNEMIINKKSGLQSEGWWASNSYSFNRHHREPSNYSRGYYGGFSTWDADENDWGHGGRSSSTGKPVVAYDANAKKDSKGNVVGGASAASNGGTTSANNAEVLKAALKQDAAMVTATVANAHLATKYVQPNIIPPTRRETFCEITGLNSLAETAMLEKDDFEQIVENYPEVAVVLLMDLVYELYILNTQTKKEAA